LQVTFFSEACPILNLQTAFSMNHRHLFVKHWLVILQIFCIAGLLSAGNDPANKTIPTLRQPEIGADGAFRFQIVGPAGERVVIETSEDLKTWHRLEEMSLTERPSIITDSNAPTTRARFYRLGWQSNVTARAWDDSEAQSVRAAGASYNDNWRESSVSYSRESLTSTASSNANETLFTRRYKVRRDLFLAALETFARTGTPPTFGHETSVRVVKEQIMTKEVASFQELVRDLFQQTGMNLQPPKAIFFNDHEGSLLVHAAQSDLNLIESTLRFSTPQPPRLGLRFKFLSCPEVQRALDGLNSKTHLRTKRNWSVKQMSLPAADASSTLRSLQCQGNLRTRQGQTLDFQSPAYRWTLSSI